MKRKRLVRAVAIASPILLGAGWWYWRSDYSSLPLRFERERWLAAEPEFTSRSVRLRMVDSLLRRHTLIGMSRDEIVALIGEPGDSGGYFKDYDLVYFLGLERDSLFAIDGEWLVVGLDEHAVASEARLVTD